MGKNFLIKLRWANLQIKWAIAHIASRWLCHCIEWAYFQTSFIRKKYLQSWISWNIEWLLLVHKKTSFLRLLSPEKWVNFLKHMQSYRAQQALSNNIKTFQKKISSDFWILCTSYQSQSRVKRVTETSITCFLSTCSDCGLSNLETTNNWRVICEKTKTIEKVISLEQKNQKNSLFQVLILWLKTFRKGT